MTGRANLELTFLSVIDLVIQFVILGILLVDYFYLQKKSIKKHGLVMGLAFLLNTILISVIMVPPFLEEVAEIAEQSLDFTGGLLWSHHILGLIAEILAGFLVIKWAAKSFDSTSCKGKKLMKVTFGTWILSIILGLVIFFLHY